MKRIRYLTTMLAALLLGSATISSQNEFDPASPTEPGGDGMLYQSRIVLLRNIDDAGTVSGAGKYYIGKSVTVYAYTNAGYSFINWIDTKGNELSTKSSFSFQNTEKADTLIANYEFAPSGPDEPADPSAILYYKLLLKPSEGLTVSGSGRYLAGKSVYCSANIESEYTFTGWYSKDGTLVSSDRYFYYTVPVGGDTLTARCEFNPGSVAEPGDPILKHNLNVTCADGGYWRGTSGRILEGTSFSLRAYKNDGYVFRGWYLNGELYTTLSSFSYTMGKEDLNFYACLEFDPASPKEPTMPAISLYSYYLPTVNGKPGSTVSYSINLVNTEIVKDMDIRLTFPAGVVVDPTDYTLSSNATGYTVTVAEAVDTISIIEPGAKLWDFSLIGGTTEPATQALLTFNVFLPDTIETGFSQQVKINQISMTMADGTPVTARTRNGCLGVYKLGDANGDDEVNIVDVSSAVSVIEGASGDSLVLEVMDTDEDGNVTQDDVDGIAAIANESGEGDSYEGTALTARFESSDSINHTLEVKVNSSEKYVAFQMDVRLPDSVAFESVELSESRMPASSSFIVNYRVMNDTANTVRLLVYNMKNTAMSGTSMDPLFNMSLTSAEKMDASAMSVSFSTVIFVRESDLAGVVPADPGDVYMLGDANGDGSVSVSDFTAIANRILGYPMALFSEEAADVNQDGTISVSDLTGVANIVLYGAPSGPSPVAAKPDEPDQDTVSDSDSSESCIGPGQYIAQ